MIFWMSWPNLLFLKLIKPKRHLKRYSILFEDLCLLYYCYFIIYASFLIDSILSIVYIFYKLFESKLYEENRIKATACSINEESKK